MEKFLTWITPGPLTEGCKFSARVVTSWITQGFALGFIAAILNSLNIATVTTGSTDPGKDFLLILLISPIPICLWGLIGVAISSIRGEKLYYPGWYWYLFPWVSMFTVSWLTFGLFIAIGDLLLGTGIKLPDLPKNLRKFDKNQLSRELNNMKVEEFLKDFEKDLEQMDQQNKLNPKQKNVVRKLREFDISKYDQRLGDVFEEDELKELILLILRLLGVEIH
ncbi:hypothetical protein [Laspinema olomoucense]|uniref:hypothetical protein n=1 Tax=Laspinema olomoucense TaxID=3231600 RepID=UPI0021BB544F|nr:hypothetical protein [Laspinema sp. D3d]MCT7973081.1 hypothetical protein [Laspinema sp. D3d]